ncbi:MAG: hypothetical protein EF813_12180 [Methanosarcinales archaeon]|nr:MAG: hypothetical protein EF813_12180 [Methanosarcinales archaeon]
MKHIKTMTLLLVLALAIAFSGCVDSNSGDSTEASTGDSAGDHADEAGGTADTAAHYLNLIDVDSMHYKATSFGDDDSVVIEEWRKKSGDLWLFKLVVNDNQALDSDVIIMQNTDGLYIIGEDGVAVKSMESSNDNIGFMNPFGGYGYYGDDSEWDDTWVVDRDVEYLGRKAIKLDYSKLWQFQQALGGDDISPEKADLIVDKETGFTLLIDWEWSHESETEGMRYEVTEFAVNENVPDSTFDIPASVEILDITVLGGIDDLGGDGELPPDVPPIPSFPE